MGRLRGPRAERAAEREARSHLKHRYAYVLPDGTVSGPYNTYQNCATAHHKALRAYNYSLLKDPGY